MPKRKFNVQLDHHLHLVNLTRLMLKGLLPVVLLISGLVLLILKMPGWSLIVGLPMLVIGTVFLIYTYDEIVSRNLEETLNQISRCSNCGEPTFLEMGESPQKVLCPDCRKKLSRADQ